MPTRNEQIAILAALTGDRVLTPAADLLGRQDAAKLSRDKFAHERRQPMHLGNGFLRDSESGQVSQDPAIADFERQKQKDALELYDAREESQFQRETRAADRSRDRAVNTGTARLSAAVARAELPAIERGIQAIDEELAPYRAANDDLPGMGGVFNKLPGITSDARQMKQRVADIRNIVLKARSGGAVTPQEADRLLEEFGLGMFNTDDDFLKAWDDFKQLVEAGSRNIYAGYDDEVVSNYERNRSREDQSRSPSDDTEFVDFGDL